MQVVSTVRSARMSEVPLQPPLPYLVACQRANAIARLSSDGGTTGNTAPLTREGRHMGAPCIILRYRDRSQGVHRFAICIPKPARAAGSSWQHHRRRTRRCSIPALTWERRRAFGRGHALACDGRHRMHCGRHARRSSPVR